MSATNTMRLPVVNQNILFVHLKQKRKRKKKNIMSILGCLLSNDLTLGYLGRRKIAESHPVSKLLHCSTSATKHPNPTPSLHQNPGPIHANSVSISQNPFVIRLIYCSNGGAANRVQRWKTRYPKPAVPALRRAPYQGDGKTEKLLCFGLLALQ